MFETYETYETYETGARVIDRFEVAEIKTGTIVATLDERSSYGDPIYVIRWDNDQTESQMVACFFQAEESHRIQCGHGNPHLHSSTFEVAECFYMEREHLEEMRIGA